MKFNYIIKSIPFLSTLILIIFLNFTNQKVNTKLKILIWNTPKLSLGTYLSVSTATGFILSYLITTNFSKLLQSKVSNKIKYKFNDHKNHTNEYSEPKNYNEYTNTLIERKITDPTPTINANFRVISSTYNKYKPESENEDNYFNDSDYSDENFNQLDNNINNYKKDDKFNSIFTDWDDDSFRNW